MVSDRKLRDLVDAAEIADLGWYANDITLQGNDLYVLLPYLYEEKPVPNWRCRVFAISDGMTAEIGEPKRIGYGRLDVSPGDFQRLPIASRKEERQLVHWLGWQAASAVWRNVGSHEPPPSS